jgi:Flp pilus assembly protein TadG
MTRSIRSGAEERGTGLIPTVAGVLVFLTLLLLAVQVTFGLLARSAVTASAFDAARIVAGADAGDREQAASSAEAAARRSLGRYGDRVRFRWASDGTDVVLTVTAVHHGLLPRPLRRPLGVDRIERTVRVRIEKPS